jgi:DNA mismatch repair protein MutL
MTRSCSPIRRLPDYLANQIAAGEVIERPASVVKELMENSIDAGAGQIRVEVDKGGMQRIQVSDDGAGIAAEQLPLAVTAHATSKLDSPETLARIASLGFRGEALASICAVSHWQLTSRQSDSDAAWQLSDENDQTRPAAHPPGTTMQVTQLFHNVPARRKFLRTEHTEYRHIDAVFRRLALSHFNTGFSLRHNERFAHRLAPADDSAGRERRVRKLCGKTFIDNATWLQLDWQGMTLKGWLGERDYSRPQGDVQYFYINGRIIRDRIITHAIRQAYQAHLYPGRFPAYVLYLELPFDEVDVNVHPTKHEVRFRQGRMVHDFLSRALREALYPDPQVQLLRQLPVYQDSYHRPAPVASVPVGEPQPEYTAAATVQDDAPPTEGERFFDHCLDILFDRFALLKRGQDHCICDLRHARQWLTQRQLSRALANGPLAPMPLLLPTTLELTAGQMETLMGCSNRMARFGMEYTASGPGAVMIRSVPVLMSRQLELPSLLPDIIRVLQTEDDNRLDETIIEAMAEHSAHWVWRMKAAQIQQLLTALHEAGGRLEEFVVELAEGDLQRLFAAHRR